MPVPGFKVVRFLVNLSLHARGTFEGKARAGGALVWHGCGWYGWAGCMCSRWVGQWHTG
jgi:hypothetical protein